ncbi:MAG: nucleotidyltransferase family protein [Leptolyngbyaceae cyanobacterium]
MAKTALELSPEEWKKYTVPKRSATPETKARFDRAWQLIPQLAQLLREEFGATQVKVFGSVLYADSFLLDSDIDLAAWDIPPEWYLQAASKVDEYSDEFTIDLVNPCFCRPGLKSAIDREGIEV